MRMYTVLAAIVTVLFHFVGAAYYASGTIPTTHQFQFNAFFLGLAFILVIINMMILHTSPKTVRA